MKSIEQIAQTEANLYRIAEITNTEGRKLAAEMIVPVKKYMAQNEPYRHLVVYGGICLLLQEFAQKCHYDLLDLARKAKAQLLEGEDETMEEFMLTYDMVMSGIKSLEKNLQEVKKMIEAPELEAMREETSTRTYIAGKDKVEMP